MEQTRKFGFRGDDRRFSRKMTSLARSSWQIFNELIQWIVNKIWSYSMWPIHSSYRVFPMNRFIYQVEIVDRHWRIWWLCQQNDSGLIVMCLISIGKQMPDLNITIDYNAPWILGRICLSFFVIVQIYQLAEWTSKSWNALSCVGWFWRSLFAGVRWQINCRK